MVRVERQWCVGSTVRARKGLMRRCMGLGFQHNREVAAFLVPALEPY